MLVKPNSASLVSIHGRYPAFISSLERQDVLCIQRIQKLSDVLKELFLSVSREGLLHIAFKSVRSIRVRGVLLEEGEAGG
jgi:hypothetical protein